MGPCSAYIVPNASTARGRKCVSENCGITETMTPTSSAPAGRSRWSEMYEGARRFERPRPTRTGSAHRGAFTVLYSCPAGTSWLPRVACSGGSEESDQSLTTGTRSVK